MGRGVGRSSGAGSRLFATYAVASLVPVVLLGAVLMQGYQQEAVERGLDQGRAQAAVIEEMAIAPALSGHDLGRGLTTGERERLRSATDLAIFYGSVIRLRLRSFSGQVVFSDDGSTAGGVPTSTPAFRAAAVGRTDIAIVRDPDAAPGAVIRVLQPVITGASGQAAGVLELYLPYDKIAAHVQSQLRSTYWQLGIGLGGLYAVLALISWSTTSRLRRHARQREHEAMHDGLTGLPNRQGFRDGVQEAFAGGRAETGCAIVLVDLDHFKEVNDTFGHHAGDELLRIVGQRLTSSLRAEDTVARLGGDEFGLILPGISDPKVVERLLEQVRRELTTEIVLDAVPLTIEASFGVALYPKHGRTLEVLLQRADAAMYQGKRGTRGIVVYTSDTAPQPTQRLVVQAELRRALERDELVLHYQSKVELATGRIGGVEALVRWAHPRRGLLGPEEFLSVAEQSDLIEPLTEWVLRRALTDQTAWMARGIAWPVAVNISARNLESPSFPHLIRRLLTEFDAHPDQLHLEVTETALSADTTVSARSVAGLAGQGITIAIDDFGRGYTSLAQLRRSLVTEVKIDQMFVLGLQHDEQDRAIVRSVIGLAHGLGCRVTAEGVETAHIRDWLIEAGCDYAQGYLFTKPVPWLELAERQRRDSAAPALFTPNLG